MLLLCTHVPPWAAGGVAASGRRWAEGARLCGSGVVWCWPGDGSIHWSVMPGGGLHTTAARREELVAHASRLGVRAVLMHYVSQASSWGGAVSEALNVPLLLNCRGNDVTHGAFQPEPPFAALVGAASHFIFVAEHLMLLLEARFGGVRGRATVVHNWLSGGEVETLAHSGARRAAGETTFGLVGIWKWKKGLEVALDALKAAPELIGRCRIYGDVSRCTPGTRAKYDEMVGRGLRPAERFEPGRAGEIYAGLDVVVVPSLVEGMPNTMMEGMAAGCAVIGSAVPGVEEVLSLHGGGVTFAAGDADALARRMLMLAREPYRARALGAEGQAAARRMAANPFLSLPPALLRAAGMAQR